MAPTTEEFVALKPKHLSMADAASMPLASMTALQALRGYEGNLKGKTVFVPAGCRFASAFPLPRPIPTALSFVQNTLY